VSRTNLVTRVTLYNGTTFSHTGCHMILDKCDGSIRVENANTGQIVKTYRRHQWAKVTQEVTQ
jgi:hypothetical protein